MRAMTAALALLVFLTAPAAIRAQSPQTQLQTIPSLGVENADIRSVFNLLADYGDVNIVWDSQVTGQITMQLRRVTWIEALDAVMAQNDLVSLPSTETLRGGMPADTDMIMILRRSDYNLRQQQEAQQQTELVTSQPLITEIIHLSHSRAQEIQTAITNLGSGDGSSITVDTRTNSLIVQDYPDYLDLIEDVIGELDIPVPQIRIEAKLLQVDTDGLRQLGLNWDLDTGGTNPLIITGTTDLATDNTIQGVLGLTSGGLTLNATISALENQGVGNVVATPSISVLDNAPGRIFMGEQVPLRQLDISGNTTIQLQEIGTELIVTPHVVQDDRIILELAPKRESFRVDPSAGIIVSTQEASTTVEVRDGETAVIGGLKSEEITEGRTGIPILMDIPLVGALFRYHTRRVVVRDLILFVTPHIERESTVITP